MEFDLLGNFELAEPIKPLINLGACMDIPSGTYIRGKYGDSVLNGGMGMLTGVVGIGNSFKSTIAHYISLSACEKIPNSGIKTYDTEMNINEYALKRFTTRFEGFNGVDMIATKRWRITDPVTVNADGKHYRADVWFDEYRDWTDMKIKNAKKITHEIPFPDRNGGQMKMLRPTFTEVDSLSEFVTNDVVKMQEDNVLGDKGGQMVFMRQGLPKTRFLQEIPFLAGSCNEYVAMTGHIGKQFEMDPNNPSKPALQFLRGQKIKGIPEKFTFLMNMCWFTYGVTVLKHKDSKAPLYPRSSDDDMAGDTDLNMVSAMVLRNKNGPSGMTIGLVVSQSEGVLPSMTEFCYIKDTQGFGISGTQQNYALDLLPDVSLSRTTVRRKIDSIPKLRRALNFTSELCQIFELWHNLPQELYIEPKKLFEILKDKGYDWDVLLQTRGYWTVDDYEQPIPRLTTMDLLRMAQPENSPEYYFPYWMNPDKSIKAPYFPALRGEAVIA